MRLRVCSVKLCTLSSKSLMHSVVLLKYHTVTERERRGGKGKISKLSLCCCAHKHCGTTRRTSTGRKGARLATWIKSSKGAARRNLNVRHACLPIEAMQPHAGKLMTAKIQKRDFTLSLGFALQRANSNMLRGADRRRRAALASGKYSSSTSPPSLSGDDY